MTNRSPQTTSELADDIRRSLESSASTVAPDSSDPTQHLRVTKDNELIPPGEPIPTGTDGRPVPHSIVPDGTFHSAGKQ